MAAGCGVSVTGGRGGGDPSKISGAILRGLNSGCTAGLLTPATGGLAPTALTPRPWGAGNADPKDPGLLRSGIGTGLEGTGRDVAVTGRSGGGPAVARPPAANRSFGGTNEADVRPPAKKASLRTTTTPFVTLALRKTFVT